MLESFLTKPKKGNSTPAQKMLQHTTRHIKERNAKKSKTIMFYVNPLEGISIDSETASTQKQGGGAFKKNFYKKI